MTVAQARPSGRNVYLDLFKFFLCYMVICIHLVRDTYPIYPLYRLKKILCGRIHCLSARYDSINAKLQSCLKGYKRIFGIERGHTAVSFCQNR